MSNGQRMANPTRTYSPLSHTAPAESANHRPKVASGAADKFIGVKFLAERRSEPRIRASAVLRFCGYTDELPRGTTSAEKRLATTAPAPLLSATSIQARACS